MIDFRYHLVSIASVFLALAVGIVLGAGPLKGTLGDTLASEVAQLRTDADSLRGSLAEAEADVSAREDVITALGPRSKEGLLAGSSVSILVLPGSSDTAVESTREAMAGSGASIAAAVTLDASWTSQDPPDITDRTVAAAELRELLVRDLPVGIAPERVIALALGWALATDPSVEPSDTATAEGDEGADPTSTAPTDAPTGSVRENDELTGATERSTEDETSARILEILEANGLLTIDGDGTTALTDGVVMVTPATDGDTTAPMTEWIDLAGAIDEAGAVIVTGALSGEPNPEADLIEAIRTSDGLRDRISTLDNVSSPVGGVALPFVVAEQLADRTGHYGELASAAQLFPPVPGDTDS